MKSFYYLHVSKASGRFFYTYVLNELINKVRDSDIEYLFPPVSDPNWTHHGWHKLINDDTYIISSLRDPVEAIVSYRMQHGGIESKEHFFSSLNSITNIQSRSFIEWDNNKIDVFKKIDFDKNIIFSRLKRVDLLIESKDININTYNTIKHKIASDLGIKDISYLKMDDTNKFKNNGVIEFCNSLSLDEISLIKKANSMDVELYEMAKSLFYPIEHNSTHVHEHSI